MAVLLQNFFSLILMKSSNKLVHLSLAMMPQSSLIFFYLSLSKCLYVTTNFRPYRKGFQGTHTLVYFAAMSVTEEKSFATNFTRSEVFEPTILVIRTTKQEVIITVIKYID
jgi:hypothetical protein